ncbi:transcriptional regulator [Faecalimonas umbilicata]|uniref:transcriptional regulator n=2 Tax=Clostridia TaxID=186801 RepID=UPI001C19844F|nr:transcriptional regulator [Faecalimonas umbilicata]HBG0145885.1 transcriptional regulator [Clostridioides difficile]
MNEITEIVEKDGFEKGYSLAMEKIKEFPNCDALIGNIAVLLEGLLIFSGKKVEKKYQEEILNLHKLASKSKDVNIREQSQGMLISKLIEKEEYDEAQEILDTFSKESWVDRKQLQANLYIAKEEYTKAARLTEEKLLSAMSEIHSCLMTLMEIAIKEERISDAEYIADVDRDAAKLFDLWEYYSYVAHSQLYDATKNRIKALKIFLPMLKSLTKKWEIEKSPLYRHIQKKEVGETIGPKFQKYFVRAINHDEEMSYLKEDPEIQKAIKKLDTD